jgi:hypothetical protein
VPKLRRLRSARNGGMWQPHDAERG